MNSYPDALYAMHELLGALGENHWRKWIAQDIAEWEDRHSVAHHLSAYGGMGSFNDVGFQDVWLGSCFDDLKSICYYLARHPVGKVNISAVRDSMSGLGLEISGCRCLSCGYGAVSTRDIDYFVARRVVRDAVLKALANDEIRELVRSIVDQRPSENSLSNNAVMDWLTKGDIHIREVSSWLRPCPSCNGDNTAVYRWQFSKQDGGKFVPSNDNLPIQHVRSSK
jgi:hypothetical protein